MLTDHLFRKLNLDDPDKDLQPGDYTYALNLYPSKEGRSTSARRESVKGTELVVSSDIQEGDRCIGAYEDKANGRLIFFNLAASGNHGVYLYDGNTIQKIYQSDTLRFNSSRLITQIAVIENFLGFIDSEGRQMLLNIEFGINGLPILNGLSTTSYDTISADSLLLIRRKPSGIPTFVLGFTVYGSSSTTPYNEIGNNSYKFYVRYVFKDGTKSVWSAPSELLVAQQKPDPDSSVRDALVRYNFESSEIKNLIDYVDFAFEKNNEGVLNIFDSPKPEIVGIFGDATTTFTAQESITTVPESEWVKPYDDIPEESNAFTIFKNTAFLNSSKKGYEDDGSYTLSVSSVSVTVSDVSSGRSKIYVKQGGNYVVGVAFWDTYGKCSPILKTSKISVPWSAGSDATTAKQLLISLSGTYPSWATKVQFFCTEVTNYEAYFQVEANLLYYVVDDDGLLTLGGNEYRYKESIYTKLTPDDDNDITLLHWQLPSNIPLVVDDSYEIRVLAIGSAGTAWSSKTDSEGIIEVRGDRLVTGKWGKTFTQINASSGSVPVYVIEVFKRNVAQDEIFYSLPRIYSTSGNPAISLQTGIDTYYVSNVYEHDYIVGATKLASGAIQQLGDFDYALKATVKRESPSPIVSNKITVSTSTDSLSKLKVSLSYKTQWNPFKKQQGPQLNFDDIERNVVFKGGYTIDYSKSATNLGFPNVVFKDYKEQVLSNIVNYSDAFVPNSSIIGINSFQSNNQYSLPAERGNVTAYVHAKEVLLALHERFVTSIYIGEGFIRQGDDAILAKTEGVIGDDRVLRGQFGCINPESIAEHDGRVWFFDLLKGEPVRYDVNGLVPLGTTYKMATYFRQKSKERLPYKDTCKVYGGYNPDLDLYFLTFEAIPEANLPTETVAFNDKQGQEGWIGWYSFAPEYYGSFNNRMVSFKSGKLYIHDTSSFYNRFHGQVAQSSEITFVCNEAPNHDKRFDNLSYIGNQGWTAPNITNDQGQKTSLVANDFKFKNGTYYADILRDENTGGDLLRPGQIALLSGKEMVSQSLKINMKTAADGEYQFIDNAQVGYIQLTGQFNKGGNQ